MRNNRLCGLALCMLIGSGCAAARSGAQLRLDDPALVEVGPSLQQPFVWPFGPLASDGSPTTRLMCKAFLPAKQEINMLLSGSQAPADCTSSRREGVQDLSCELKPAAGYSLRLTPTVEGEKVRVQLVCFQLPSAAAEGLAGSVPQPLRPLVIAPAATGIGGVGAPTSPSRPRVERPRPERAKLDKPRPELLRAEPSKPAREPIAKPRLEKSEPAETKAEPSKPDASSGTALAVADGGATLRHISEVRGDPPSELTLDCKSSLREGERGTIAVQDGKRWVQGRYLVIDGGSCEIEIKNIANPQTVLVRGHAVRMQGSP